MGDDFRELFDSLETKLNTSFYDDAGNIRVDSTKFDEPGWFAKAGSKNSKRKLSL